MIDLEEIFKTILEYCNVVNKCMEDDDYLCNVLCSLDRDFLQNYYNSDNSGPIIDIRKKLCEEILLGRKVTSEKLNDIIYSIKSTNEKAFKSYSANFNILNNLIINKFKIDDRLEKHLYNLFDSEVKTKVWDFKGPRNHGQNHYCLVFYNKSQKSQSTSLQIFIDFKVDNEVKYGVWKESSKEYIIGPFYCGPDEYQNIFDFITENKNIILNDYDIENNSKIQMNFIEAAKLILDDFGNKPMSSREIWDEINKRDLVKTEGKTPCATMNTIILNNCVDSPTSGAKSKNIFKIVDRKPTKFILNNFMSKNIKDIMINNGFITMDMLKIILKKNRLEW